MNTIAILFSVLILCIPTFATAFDKSSNSFSNNDEFLKVEDAYQLAAEINDNTLSLAWSAAPTYYLYQHKFAVSIKKTTENSVKDTELVLKHPPGISKYDDYFQKELEVYYSNVTQTISLQNIEPPFSMIVKSQACADAGLCYPPRKHYFEVDKTYAMTELSKKEYRAKMATTEAIAASPNNTQNSGNAINSANTTTNNVETRPSATPAKAPFLPLAMFYAMIGGLILNLMPCVFPILSLKALSLANNHDSPVAHGWSYTVGVVISFLIFAGFILVARSAGENLGWGFQLQHPVFIGAMVYLFFIMGLSLSGMFHIGGGWMGAGQQLTSGDSLRSSFFTGVLAVLVASPCTAPFMAPALGAAMTMPTFSAIAIFIALGFGMALPFLLLSYIPKLGDYLPAPGAWMETMKEFLAFPLYFTSVWLLWVLGNQVSHSAVIQVILGLTILTLGIWFFSQNKSSLTKKIILNFSTIICAFFAFKLLASVNSSNLSHDNLWQTYSAEKLEELRSNGQPILLDVTADWCITCKVNERVVLNNKTILAETKKLNFARLQADWTNENPTITKLLESFGRNGVPLYVIYSQDKNQAPEVLPQILTEDMLLKAMRKAASSE